MLSAKFQIVKIAIFDARPKKNFLRSGFFAQAARIGFEILDVSLHFVCFLSALTLIRPSGTFSLKGEGEKVNLLSLRERIEVRVKLLDLRHSLYFFQRRLTIQNFQNSILRHGDHAVFSGFVF